MQDFSQLKLQTARLALRPLQPGDAPALYAMCSDAEFMRFWSTPCWTSPAQATELIEGDQQALVRGEHLRLGLIERGQGGLIGTCSLFNFHPASRRAELGYGVARPHWRQGYVHEALQALLAWAFTELGLRRLEADIDPRNLGSARSLEKLGFVREGLLRERWLVGQEVSDSALYGLLARDWPPRAPAVA